MVCHGHLRRLTAAVIVGESESTLEGLVGLGLPGIRPPASRRSLTALSLYSLVVILDRYLSGIIRLLYKYI